MNDENGMTVTALYRGRSVVIDDRLERILCLLIESREKIAAEPIGTVEIHFTEKKVYAKLKKHLGLEVL